jgi:hypothetical protein
MAGFQVSTYGRFWVSTEGRYRPIAVSLWGSDDFQKFSANARLVAVNLMTGSSSNLAGINFVYLEAVVRETGLTMPEVDTALHELEKKPTPGRSFIVRDQARGVIWVRTQLRDDPGIGQNLYETHRKGIETILGSLPSDSPVVRQFRNFYPEFRRHRVSPTQSPKVRGGVREVPDTDTQDGNRYRHRTGSNAVLALPVLGPNVNSQSQTNGAAKGHDLRAEAERVLRSRGYNGMQVISRLQDWQRAVDAGGDPRDPALVPA